MTLALRYAVRSDVGLLREGNEDSAYAGPHLLAVADGMGGYEAGEVASAAVISAVAPLDRTVRPESELIDALSGALASAKRTLRGIVEADPAVGSMGTTLTAMLWSGGMAAICHIGDSRAYLLRDGDLYQITRDHTFVQALIDQGRIRPEEAATHPQRSMILRALDGRTDAEADMSMLTADAGDRLLLCSDGLPVAVSDAQILQALSEVPEPADAVLKLIDLALAGGAPDNVTCIVADVIDPDQGQATPTRAPVVAGAAASGGANASHDTKPFTKPVIDSDASMTRLGTSPPPAPGTAPPTAPGKLPGSPPAHGRSMPGRAGGRRGAPDDDDTGRPSRRRWPVMTSILALFVLLIGGGLAIGYQYVHSQYYVGIAGGKVAIFRGINEQLFGISLSSVDQPQNIPVSGVPRNDVAAIQRASTGSLAQAQRFVAVIRADYNTCQAAYAALARWQAGKPKPVRKRIRVNGSYVYKTVTPPYRPKPTIPPMCPAQPAPGA